MSDSPPATASSAPTRRAAFVMVSAFAALVLLPGLLQTVAAVGGHASWPSLAELVVAPTRAWAGSRGASLPRRMVATARAATETHRTFEIQIEDGWVLGRTVRPALQRLLATRLRTGSSRVLVGSDGVLYFRPAVEHALGPSFLAPRQLERRSAAGTVNPDPRPAILAFKEALEKRGIALVLVPVPDKTTVEPEHLAWRPLPQGAVVDNPGTGPLIEVLKGEGVLVFDPTATLLATRASGPVYLASDTHWRPEAMAAVAKELAAFIRERVELTFLGDPGYQTEGEQVTNRGDLAAMLELSVGPGLLGTETVGIERVIGEGDMLWRLDTRADLLLLGDSFTNIYSLPAMGWGEAAGFAEHLSLALGRPLDAITRNDSGAWATRSLLAAELSRGRDRLAGKRVVVWELASRELSLGDWKPIRFELGTPASRGFFLPALGSTVSVSGVITAMGVVPRPRSAPYADFIVALHLEDLSGDAAGGQALVFVQAMKDYELTPSAHLRVGQRFNVKLRRWSEVASEYDLINRGELFDGDLMMQEPCWGEEVTQ